MSTLIKPPPADPSKSAIESVLELKQLTDIDPGLFTNTRPLWHPPGARGIYGGAVIAQCLAAAQRTVRDDFTVHSMHCYFVLAGSADIPIMYHVEKVRDGRSFATRTVQARQRGRPIFTTTMSFVRENSGGSERVEHAIDMPAVPEPSDDLNLLELDDSPFECQRIHILNHESDRPQDKKTRQWIKARGKISPSGGHQAHLSALAYMSDSWFIGTVSRVHRLWRFSTADKDGKSAIDNSVLEKLRDMDDDTLRRMQGMDEDVIISLRNMKDINSAEHRRPEVGMMVSLDHTIYFHSPRNFRADEWMFTEMESPWAGDGRGLVLQRMFTKDGELVATCVQEGVVRLKENNNDVSSKLLKEPWKKYPKFQPLDLPNRQWPSKTIDKAPRWLSTDLRDGNQSLVDPMDGEQKWRYFQMLVKLGYKEIEVSFPSASDTDFDFTRRLVTTPGVVPDDVALQVLSPCRKELIRRTVDSLKGAKKAILHLYLATSPCFQQIVFNMNNEQSKALAVECTKYARSITKDDPEQKDTDWSYEFSPETFSDSDPDFVLEVCEAVKAAWEPTEEKPIIFNLPATVEMSTPNVYADQIEYFCRNISEREKICVSLHPHNDRGCAVAAAELAQMAGADRVEGTLFGNGERTGNVDLVTLALNLYTQGVPPNIDFSDINSVIDIVEKSNKIPVHPRAPYGGQLVVCAFSGSHQDAIKKGFHLRKQQGNNDDQRWQIPYLPLDPQDIGRTYEAIIRVNSQSGKGGVAWIIQRTLELDMPRGLQVAFSKIVQKETDALGRELQPTEIKNLFVNAYHLEKNPRFHLIDYDITTDRSISPAPPTDGKTASNKNLKRRFDGVIEVDGKEHRISGVGNGALSSLANALKSLNIHLDVDDYKEHAIGRGSDVKAATYIECSTGSHKVWGVGIHQDVVQASLIALLSAASSFLSSRPGTPISFSAPKLESLKLNDAPSSGPDSTSHVVANLEARAENGNAQ
ncbi:2-isopropylmalate synthase [Aureobasidium sp. EXF-12298]|nr:2-isopropylmalate synthase [Aureobasidium sp. EXF-12298]KAI4762338.1 2-isopropylmalate synthase [Aureobasidium sp. EXF-12344]KAI4772259.1 2-isopropylmalate synthase [Aureobasidium sp. EXF-3400]